MPTSPVQIPIPSRPGSAPPTMADGDAAEYADDRVSAADRDACFGWHLGSTAWVADSSDWLQDIAVSSFLYQWHVAVTMLCCPKSCSSRHCIWLFTSRLLLPS
jgi:hypothetical protein